jgi:hypothetical protein
VEGAKVRDPGEGGYEWSQVRRRQAH